MNILYMMTKTCKYINFYRVNMNYLQNDIYIYSSELYTHTIISCSTETVSVHSLSSSVLPAAHYDIYENVKKISYHIYKEIHMNILYMMTKTCKYINL